MDPEPFPVNQDLAREHPARRADVFPISALARDFEGADVRCHAFGEYEVCRSSPQYIRLCTATSISKGSSALDQPSMLIGTPGFSNEATFSLLGARSPRLNPS
jgi:hypothetical protein